MFLEIEVYLGHDVVNFVTASEDHLHTRCSLIHFWSRYIDNVFIYLLVDDRKVRITQLVVVVSIMI